MHNCVLFSKHSKTVDNLIVTDPRFNIMAYTQPTTAANVSKKQNTDDGFFQRFLVALPGGGLRVLEGGWKLPRRTDEGGEMG